MCSTKKAYYLQELSSDILIRVFFVKCKMIRKIKGLLFSQSYSSVLNLRAAKI